MEKGGRRGAARRGCRLKGACCAAAARSLPPRGVRGCECLLLKSVFACRERVAVPTITVVTCIGRAMPAPPQSPPSFLPSPTSHFSYVHVKL